MQQSHKSLVIKVLLLVMVFGSAASFTKVMAQESIAEERVHLLPLKNYAQLSDLWINPKAADYDKPLLGPLIQHKRYQEFINRFFTLNSQAQAPWSADYINQILKKTNEHGDNSLVALEQQLLQRFSNHGKTVEQFSYGANFRPYPELNLAQITSNMNIPQFKATAYNPANRAITITNLAGRMLPSADMMFNNYKVAGEGFPFDNLQQSAVWAGTPVYIVMQTKDLAWSLVITPDFMAWVKSDGLARASQNFIKLYQKQVASGLYAITEETSIVDSTKVFRFTAYVGSVFPLAKQAATIVIPVADIAGNAQIAYAKLDATALAAMPLSITPHNMARILTNLSARQYGWGNLSFYNDCSAELKSLFTPFAIYLNRNSGQQIYNGKMVDLSALSDLEREKYLITNGQKLLTLVRIRGHVALYIGNYTWAVDGVDTKVAMSYQDAWGLSPADNSYRAVIGMSLFLPLLQQYPEDLRLVSLYNKTKRPVFQLVYLSQLPSESSGVGLQNIFQP